MSVTDRTNIVCFCIVIVFSIIMGMICKKVWKDKWLPCLVWIITVDVFSVFFLVFRLVTY